MTQAMVSDIAQTLPFISNAKSNQSPQEEKRTLSPNAGAVSTKDIKPILGDTINLSYQSRQTITDAKNEEAKKKETNKINDSGKYDMAIGKVQFVYDLKGVLSVRYMDSANRLIYQVPSELMLRLKEAASKSDSSVDMKA